MLVLLFGASDVLLVAATEGTPFDESDALLMEGEGNVPSGLETFPTRTGLKLTVVGNSVPVGPLKAFWAGPSAKVRLLSSFLIEVEEQRWPPLGGGI